MPPPIPGTRSTPTFYLTARQPIRPAILLLAMLAAAATLCAFIVAMNHTRRARLRPDGSPNSASSNSSASQQDDKDDDPNQIDTIVLGDPADAPVPARAPGGKDHHVSPVHPTIVVRLPRFGDETGLIPNSPAGHLLYAWLAAFNHTSASGLADALPTGAPAAAIAAQIELRRQTGGFNLLSAKEVQPGILVFRLRDQTPAGTESLGTLQLTSNANPPTIATFSLRAVKSPEPQATPESAAGAETPPR